MPIVIYHYCGETKFWHKSCDHTNSQLGYSLLKEINNIINIPYSWNNKFEDVSLFSKLNKFNRKIKDKIKYGIYRMIFEESIKNPELKIYQLFPGICVQELQLNKSKSKLDSLLQSERIVIQKENEVKEKRTVLENIIRLFTKHKRIVAKRNKQKFIITFKLIWRNYVSHTNLHHQSRKIY